MKSHFLFLGLGLTLTACVAPNGQNANMTAILNPFTTPLSNSIKPSTTTDNRNYNQPKTTAVQTTTPLSSVVTAPAKPATVTLTPSTVQTTNRAIIQGVPQLSTMPPGHSSALASTSPSAVAVRARDGSVILLQPGQTYYGPDGRLYVYDPQGLPVVTSGF